MSACCFSQHPELPLSCMGSQKHNPSFLLPSANLLCPLPLCHCPSSMHRFPVPSFLVSSGPDSHFLLFSTISPIFLVQLLPTFHPSSFQPQFPTPAPRPGFLQWGPNIFSTPSTQFQSFTAGCFSLPVYANSANKVQVPSFSLLGIQEAIDTEHKSPWLYQEAPRRALPENLPVSPCSHIDRPEHKSAQTETSKRSAATLRSLCQECANCNFARIYSLAESGYFSQEPELSCTTFFLLLHFGRGITTRQWLMLCRKSSFKHSVVLCLSREKMS